MAEPSKDAAVLAVLVQRFETQRLPRLIDLKKKVDQGGLLDDLDIKFLEQVRVDSDSARRLAAQHPEYQELIGRAVQLYSDIVDTALKNEREQ